jgi:hypothetical protein
MYKTLNTLNEASNQQIQKSLNGTFIIVSISIRYQTNGVNNTRLILILKKKSNEKDEIKNRKK